MTATLLRDNCIICGSREYSLLYDRGRGKRFNTVVCDNCGFVFVPQKQGPAETQEYFDHGGYRKHGNMDLSDTTISAVLKKEERARGMAMRRFENLKVISPEILKKKGPVHDIGASLGLFLELWKNEGFDPSGVEPDVYYAALGTKHFGFPIEPILYENKAKERPGYFQIITLCHVLEHCRNAREVLRQIRRELRDDGYFYVEIPTIDRPYGGNLDRFFWAEHVNYFSRNSLRNILEMEGFMVEYIGEIGRFLCAVVRKGELPSADHRYIFDKATDVKHRVMLEHTRHLERERDEKLKNLNVMMAKLTKLVAHLHE